MRPLVTIFTSCFNHEKYLREYFEGLLSQTYDHVELIFFNDGSKDRSWEIAESYRPRLEKKFTRVIMESHPNQGLLGAHAAGMRLVTGDLLCFLGSDDYYLPEKIEENVKFFDSHPDYGVVHSDIDFVHEDGRIVSAFWANARSAMPEGYVFENLLTDHFILPISVCMKTGLFKRHVDFAAYHAKGYLMEDTPMYLDLARHTKFGYIPKVLARYRVVRGSVSHPTDGRKLLDYRKSIQKVRMDFARQYGIGTEIERKIEKAYYRELYNVGYNFGLKEACLTGYRWLAKHYPAEYANYWYGARAFSTVQAGMWKLMQRFEKENVIHRVKRRLGLATA